MQVAFVNQSIVLTSEYYLVFTPSPAKALNQIKKFLVIFVAGISLISCAKKVSTLSEAANQNVFFQDANVAVQNMTAVPTATNTVTVSFSTAFENNVSRLELMSSATTDTFCPTQGVDVTGNSSVTKNYSFNDANIKGSTMYYMLRFKDTNGNWTYSPYLTVRVK